MAENVSRTQWAGAWLPAVTAIVVGVILTAPALQAQDRSRYRDFQLGSNLTTVAALAQVSATGAKTIHQRPAVIQELDWRPPYTMSGTTASQNDPVQRIVFGFYDDQLFKLAISYDRQRTNGLTEADMIEAISATYGTAWLQASPQKTPAVAPATDNDLGAPIAQWGSVDYEVALYQSSFASEFRVVITSSRLATLAATAVAEATRLDESEAPQREIDRMQKEAEEIRTSREKARLANKATFKP